MVLLETSEEVVEFYTSLVLTEGADLASGLTVSSDDARQHLLEHIRICFDTCHVALEYEDPRTVMDRFEQVGIKVGKVQISLALKVAFSADPQVRTALAQSLERLQN